MLEATCRLYELNNAPHRAPISLAVATAKQHLFQHQGHVGAYLLIGGVDADGSKLVNVSAHGSSMIAPYMADGSGSYAAIALLEQKYKFGLSVGALLAHPTHCRSPTASRSCRPRSRRACTATTRRATPTASPSSPRTSSTATSDPSCPTSPSATTSAFPLFISPPLCSDIVYKHPPGTTKVLKMKRIEYEIVSEERMEE